MDIDGRYIKDAVIGSMSGVLIGLALIGLVRPFQPAPVRGPTYADVVKDIEAAGGSMTVYVDGETCFARIDVDGDRWEAHAGDIDTAARWALDCWLGHKTGKEKR